MKERNMDISKILRYLKNKGRSLKKDKVSRRLLKPILHQEPCKRLRAEAQFAEKQYRISARRKLLPLIIGSTPKQQPQHNHVPGREAAVCCGGAQVR